MKKEKMMKRLAYVLMVFLAVGVAGCKMKQGEVLRPKISGSAGEVLVVAPDHVWNSPAGDTLRKLFSQEVPFLPQPEPMFNVLHITPGNFDKMFHTHRNILIMQTGSQFKEPRLLVSHDRWATPQLLITIQAPNVQEMAKALHEGGDELVKRINDMEKKRIIDYYKHYLATDVYNKVKEKYHILLDIPKGYTLDVDSADFAWISSETPQTSQGILIYTYPYRSEKIFNVDSLMDIRDRVLKKYVHGQIEGTYMATERQITPDFRTFKKDGQYFAEMRGLWKLENGFMGGPFVSLTTVDEARQRVVTVDGYVYAPGQKKRELMRQVESIVQSLKIVPPEKK